MQSEKTRSARFAGQFYPSSAGEINKQIKAFLGQKTATQEAIACMVPHAGYTYSGYVATQTISQIKLKDKIILLGPNHTGLGAAYSIVTQGAWQTPLGEVPIENKLAKAIKDSSRYLKEDPLAHAEEHSLEVELPILQYFKTDFSIVPIAFLSDDISALKAVGREIAAAILDLKLAGSVLLVASSDLTHYEPQTLAQNKDKQAIEAILALDEDELMKRVRAIPISMCGYAPVVVMLSAAKALGAKKGELIKYQTSGDSSGDASSVVGYAGIIIF